VEASELPALIKAHRAVYRTFCKAIDQLEKRKDAIDGVVVPCLLGGGFSLRQGYEFCQEHLASAYKNQRDRLPQLSRVAPELAEQFRAVMDEKEAENMALLDDLYAEVAAVERNYEATSEAEEQAASAVCGYRCRTIEEAKLKAKYLAEAPGLRDGLTEEQVEALLQSSIGEEAA
jgi:hypothetical protein